MNQSITKEKFNTVEDEAKQKLLQVHDDTEQKPSEIRQSVYTANEEYMQKYS